MFVKNITETTQKIRIDWVETEIGAWEVFQTTESKAEELVRNYPSIIGYADAEDISWSGEISDLDDVEITNPTDWQIMSFDGTSEKWKNSTLFTHKAKLNWVFWNHFLQASTQISYTDTYRISLLDWYYFKEWTVIKTKSNRVFGLYYVDETEETWYGQLGQRNTTYTIPADRIYYFTFRKNPDNTTKFTGFDYKIEDILDLEDYSMFYEDVVEKPSKRAWKIITFCGDSITYGTWTEIGRRYCDYLKNWINPRKFNVVAEAWRCISVTSDYWQTHSPWSSSRENVPNSDLIVFFSWTNDYWHDTPMGQFTDWSATDTSFYSACRKTLAWLMNRYPSAKLIVMTPLHRTTQDKTDRDWTPNGQWNTLNDYREALMKVCREYWIPVIDLYSNIMQLSYKNTKWKEYFVPDWVHPNPAWHMLMAKYIAPLLETL